MSSDRDYLDSIVKLLSTLELEDCLALVADLIISNAEASAVGVLIWDSDIQSLLEPECFGEQKKRLKPMMEDLYDVYEDLDEKSDELDLTELSPEMQDAFEFVQIKRLRHDNELCAVIVIAEPQNEDAVKEIFEKCPLSVAIHNAWTYSELERENKRLRSQYEDMEGKTDLLQQQTMDLINSVTARDSLRTKQVERERLVFRISHTVKSSMRIQEVLATTVVEIGKALSLSRCHLIHALGLDKFDVFDFQSPGIECCHEKFMVGEGLRFAEVALSKKNAEVLDDQSMSTDETPGSDTDVIDERSRFSRNFLEEIGMKSGLIQPLIMRDRVLGVLFLVDCETVREWSIDDLALLGSLADHLAVAIENAELHMEIERQAVTDGLTGVANRRSFNESLLKEFERAKRYGQPLSLAVVDLDNLKKINDTYGHMTGDEAIKSIGCVLAQSSRVTDITARYGGEEFCVLLPNTDIEMAEQLAERLRRLIREIEIDGPGALSASIGVASYPLHAEGPDTLFLRADEALYRAKQEGRNRVKVSSLGPDGRALEPVQKPKSKQPLVPETS